MAQLVKLLDHQARLLQAPFVFLEKRFFFLIAGYGSGKTRGLVFSVQNSVKQLLGKKEKGGTNPKILVGSKNITFLAKTWTNDFEAFLQATGSTYSFDKAKNIITIGNVQIILVALEEPSAIYGYSVACFRGDTLVATEKGNVFIKDLKKGDKVLTTKGFKKIKNVKNQGIKECIKVTVDGTDIVCTPDHKFIDYFDNEIEAKDLTKTTSLVKLNTKEWQKWLNMNGEIEQSLKLTNMPWLQRAHLTAKTSNVVGRYTVYDIEVEECHEFFANGVRVHNCAYLDEVDELPTAVSMEAIKSVNDRVRQHCEGFRNPFIVMVSTSQGLKGLYQTYHHFKENKIGFVLMRARTQDNYFNGEDYIKTMYSMYKGKERECLLEGRFVSIDSGLVFPDYDPKENDLSVDLYDSLEDFDTVYIGQDFNTFGNAGVACVVKKGALVIIKDYEIPDIRKAPQVFRYDFPTQKIVWIPDATAKENYSQYKKELRQYNITIAYRKSNPLVQDRNFAVNRMLTAKRMFICPMATRMKNAFVTHQKDPKTGQPMKGGKGAPDHWSDCLGYVTHYVLCWHKDMKTLYDFTLGRLYEKRRAQGAESIELEVPTMLMKPERLRAMKLDTPTNMNS